MTNMKIALAVLFALITLAYAQRFYKIPNEQITIYINKLFV